MNELDSKQNTSLGAGAKHYMPGLDGLRALSVLAVIAYHLNFHWAQGGFLGVGIFFTLSGYLITDQLMLQWQRSGKIDLKDFWIRRARRLMPAMFFMLAVVCLWLNFFDKSRLGALKGDFASVALYVNNWWLIFHNVSYFESFGPPSPIGHLWSLAIEEQFYILWPLILMLMLRFAHRRSKLILFTLFGAAASIFAMALIYQPGADPSRVYYGTDTRAFALLIGAAFAIAFPSRNLPKLISAKTRLALDLIGGAGLLGIILMIRRTNEYDSSLYIGGLALFTVLSAIVVVILAHPASHAARFIGCKPLRWVGIRSYSLYLWHYPVMTLTTPAVDVGGFNAGRTIIQLIMSFLLAALSWKFIEDPIRRGSVSRLWGNMHVLKAPFQRRFLLVLVMTPLFLFVNSCSSRMNVENKLSAASPESTEQVLAVVPQTTDEKPLSQIADSTKPAPDIPKQQPEEQSLAGKPSAAEIETAKVITAIGDSVILDAAPYLEKLLPGIIIDGKY